MNAASEGAPALRAVPSPQARHPAASARAGAPPRARACAARAGQRRQRPGPPRAPGLLARGGATRAPAAGPGRPRRGAARPPPPPPPPAPTPTRPPAPPRPPRAGAAPTGGSRARRAAPPCPPNCPPELGPTSNFIYGQKKCGVLYGAGAAGAGAGSRGRRPCGRVCSDRGAGCAPEWSRGTAEPRQLLSELALCQRRLNLRRLRAPRAGSGAPAAGLAAGSGPGAGLCSGRVAEEGVSGGLPGALTLCILGILRVERVAVVPELSQAG